MITSSSGNRSSSFAETSVRSSDLRLTFALSSRARTRDWLSVTAVIVERPKAFDSTSAGLLTDPKSVEILINADGQIWFERAGDAGMTLAGFPALTGEDLVEFASNLRVALERDWAKRHHLFRAM